jgi:UDP-2-acetamido-3-amino-2,3-dideoxy-glucuronate N-acetyltransferase
MDESKYISKDAWKNRHKKSHAKKENSFYVDETSIIDENVRIGENSKVWHFSHILSGSIIGKNCSFGQNCVVGPKVKIGNGVKVQNNVSVYEGVEIEDDVFLGPSMVFTNVLNPRAFIVRKDEFKKTLLKKGSSIGANATIICGVSIGEYALIGSGAVINKDVKPYALMAGVPAKQIGWVGISGNTLSFIEDQAEDDYASYVLENDMLKVTKK